MVSPSNRAKTILVFPESIASSMVPVRCIEKDVARHHAADLIILIGQFQRAIGAETGEAPGQNALIGQTRGHRHADSDCHFQPRLADRSEPFLAPDAIPM